MHAVDFSPGEVLGQYEIVDVLGRGGMGVVYKARHLGLDRMTALKILHGDLVTDPEFVLRFTQEARLSAKLQHPNIATVYDFGQAGKHYYIAMRLADGVPLSKLLSEPVPLEITCSVVKQICNALVLAHEEGVVHRDLKPANILVNNAGEAVLTDFGIAKSVRQEGLTVAGTLVGTPEYMSPEQALAKRVDHRSDLYAIGVMLYESCTGRPPFYEETPVQTAMKHVNDPVPLVRDTVPDIPEWVDEVVQKCCAKNPDERYASAAQLIAALPPEIVPPVAIYPDVMARAGMPDFGSTLTAILQGSQAAVKAIEREPDWEQAIRHALEREVTVACLDIVGSRRMKAPGATVKLSYLFEKVRRFIDATCDEHACIAKSWSGDGLAAVFEDAGRAVTAMKAVIRDLGSYETPDPKHPFRVRVGVHSGLVLLPDSKDLGRVTSRVFDAAGHLQKEAGPNEIRASEEVVKSAGLQGEFAPLGPRDDIYAYSWEGLPTVVTPAGAVEQPSALKIPVRSRPAAPAGQHSRPCRTPLYLVAAALVMLVVATGGYLGLRAFRASRADAEPPGAPAGLTGGSALAAGGQAGTALPDGGESAGVGSEPGPEAITPAGGGGDPSGAAPAPVRIEARVSVAAPAGALVEVAVYDIDRQVVLSREADGAVRLSRPGRYQIGVNCEQATTSGVVDAYVVIEAENVSESRRVEGLYPHRDHAGREISSQDRCQKVVGALVIAPDGSMRWE